MSRPDADGGLPPSLEASLCVRCAEVKTVRSARGSVFLNCGLAAVDERFPKYPPQPVVGCQGFRPDDGSAR